MKDLIPRTESRKDQISHFGLKDPNLTIYRALQERGDSERADRFLKYREEWEAVRSDNATPNRPLHVTFALADACNLMCTHCVRRFRKRNESGRKRTSLDFELFRRAIDQCADLGVNSILLGAEAEVFLYEQVTDAIRYVSEKRFDDFWLITNGLLLSDRHADTILQSDVKRLEVSIDAITPETYEKTRGKGFFGLMTNIFAFLDRRARLGSGLPILRVSFVKYGLNQHEAGPFVEFWRAIADEVDVQTISDPSNVDALRYSAVEDPLCRYPNNMLCINWKGDYKPCCDFYNKYLVLGNVRDISVGEAWNSQLIRDLRSQFRGDAPLNRVCINCIRSFGADVEEPSAS